jgi:four helix bundle protein
MIASHRDLIVWQKGMDLSVRVYAGVKGFPSHERFGLSSQLTRAVISVPANIAEGYARASTRDYAHFLAIAKGSLMDAETYILLAERLDYVASQAVRPLLDLISEISRMLTALRSRLLS